MERTNYDFLRRVLIVALVGIALIGFWYLRSLWILGFASVVIAVGISLPANWLQQHGMGRGVALATAAVGVIVGAFALMLLVILPMTNEISDLIVQTPQALENASRVYERWRTSIPILGNFLPAPDSSEILQQLGTLVNQVDYNTLQELSTAVFQTGSTILPSLFKGLGFFFALLANLLFVVFIAIFLLLEPISYVKASLFLLPEKFHGRALRVWSELYRTLTAWIATQFLSVSITMVLVWFTLRLLNVPGAGTIALLAGFATFIPNIGAFLPLFPIVFFILVQPDPRPLLLLRAIPAYLLIQFVESNIITPRLIKSQLDIPSGALLFFQVIAATIFGALGLLLAVPMLATLITLIREVYSYDLLQLRGKAIEIVSLDTEGTLALRVPGLSADEIEDENPAEKPPLFSPSFLSHKLNPMRIFGRSDSSPQTVPEIETSDLEATQLPLASGSVPEAGDPKAKSADSGA